MLACVLSIGGLLLSGKAVAQDGGESGSPTLESGGSRVIVVGKAGFGGEAVGETREFVDGDQEDVDDFEDVEMEATHGLAGEYSYAVHENFLIGGRLSLNWVNTDNFDEAGIDRSLLANLDVVPRGRLPVSGAPIEFYLAVPLGVTLNFPNEDLEDFGFAEEDFYTGTSLNISVLAGMTYWLGTDVGIFIEEGAYHQRMLFPSQITGSDPRIESIYAAGFTQFSVLAGLQIAL